jgi:osmotically-inducible protein OsmY
MNQSKYSKYKNLVLASSIAMAIGGANSVFAADTVPEQLTQARQETQIWTTYALSPYLRASDLQVSVHDGKATLTGTVEDDVNRDLAKQIALGVSGVKEVDNKIVVQADYTPPKRSAERSYGERIDDATVTAKVKSKLLWSTYTSGMSTNVDTSMGKVTLSGSADSAAAKELAGSLARNTSGVVAVDNQLIIEAPKAAAASEKAPAHQGNVVADSWISAKVKSTFMYSSNVDSSEIAVKTSDGVVTLSGKVDSGTQRSLAIELAKNIRGVQSVESEGLVI